MSSPNDDATNPAKPILAVCGKGGVGKTAFSALLARALREAGTTPLLLIDADPAGGLLSAIGEAVSGTLAGVREALIATARGGEDAEKERLARQVDYLVMEALAERADYSVLAMGHGREKGCFCPANVLLRDAIDLVSDPFAAVLIDAEAGIEQISRQVTRRVTRVIGVTDGSLRSREVVELIAAMVEPERLAVVSNRAAGPEAPALPAGVLWLGAVPEDEAVRTFDRRGRPLWDLPADNPALAAVREIAVALGGV